MDEYPNSSDSFSQQWTPEKPADRVEVEDKEQAKVSSSIGVVQDVIKWFDDNADFYKSVDSLNINDTTTESDAKLAVLLNKKMRAAFQSKSTEFRAVFAKYLKAKEDDPQA